MKKLILIIITTLCLGFTAFAQEDINKLKVNPYITVNAGTELGKIHIDEIPYSEHTMVTYNNLNVGAGVIFDDAITLGISYRQNFYAMLDILETVTARSVTLDLGFIIMPNRVYSIYPNINLGYEFAGGGGNIINANLTQRIRICKILYFNITTGYNNIVSSSNFYGQSLEYRTSHFIATTGLTFKF